MTNEELEKAMQFILEQQAQFAANQQLMQERQVQFAANQQSMQERQAELADDQQQLDGRVSRLETNMAEMARAQTDMVRSQSHLNEVVAVMLETHRHTEEKLDAFVGVLERYISEGRDGRNGNEDAP